MLWPYNTNPLTPEEKDTRRQVLNLYAGVAFFSSLLPAIIFFIPRLYHLTTRLLRSSSSSARHGKYTEVPNSPLAKAQRLTTTGSIATKLRIFRWWTQDKVHLFGYDLGHRDEWILGVSYAAWLLVLCIAGTGHDYFHLVKRFGFIAISQMPLQYLMSLKVLNPLAWVFQTSHEQINRYHRVLGRVIYTLLICHIFFYNAFFLYAGIWLKRFFAPVVFWGVLASLLMHALFGTATTFIRSISYRMFFVTHLIAALFIPVFIFFHAPHSRIYIVFSVAIFVIDLGVRRVTTVTTASTIESIPGTQLIKIAIPLSQQKLDKFRAAPGSHVYLSLPPAGRNSSIPSSTSPMFDFLYNPFTVASVTDDNSSINLVVRQRHGPMTNVLSRFASKTQQLQSQATFPLAVEGPYGVMTSNYQKLVTSGINRVLLIAGGVGATFAMPIYHAIQNDMPTTRIQLVWAIRSASDATWAVLPPTDGKALLKDAGVQLFLTGDAAAPAAETTVNPQPGSSLAGPAVEMNRLHPDRNRPGRLTSQTNRRRPDLQKIIDEAFRLSREEPVAILVCGPREMAADVRKYIRPWAMNGRDVWWHNESFGW